MLVTRGRVTLERLYEVLRQAEQEQTDAAEVLLRHDGINRRELSESLSAAFGCPFWEPGPNRPPFSIYEGIPADLMRRHVVAPLARQGSDLTMVMLNPDDLFARDDMLFVTGATRAQRYVGLKRDILALLDRMSERAERADVVLLEPKVSGARHHDSLARVAEPVLWRAPGMSAMHDAFEQRFGVPFARLPIPNTPIVQVLRNSWLFGSQAARDLPILADQDLDPFVTTGRPEYFLVGFWGRAVDDYAFYYARDDGTSRIYFRLALGGLPSGCVSGSSIGHFLAAFFAFEAAEVRVGSTVLAVDLMSSGRYAVTRPDGSVRACGGSLLTERSFLRSDWNFHARFRATDHAG